MNISIYVLINLLLLVFNNIDEGLTQSVNITLKNGQINGQLVIIDDKPVNRFLGIPYAKPPIGDLRFKKPVKIEQWSDPIDATKWPNPCIQKSGDDTSRYKNANFSEDCLYLNIWSPFDDINYVNDRQLKAVMFWIHGGGLIGGSSDLYLYDGQQLSTLGDVVVVTINYRLNVFGFFYSGTDDAPGNVGLWDQALALQWVNDNIRYFGGDHNRITIFGESAGSWSVSLLILSPITKNLYQNAIMMSGAVLSEELFDYSSVAKSKWLYKANQIGCESNSNDSNSSVKVIECFRNIDAKTLLKITDFKEPNQTQFLNVFIVIDGTIITSSPKNLIKSGTFNKPINLLISTMEDEGSLSLAYELNTTKFNAISPQNLTKSEAMQELKQIFSQRYIKAAINGEDVTKVYFNKIADNSTDYDLIRRTIGIAFGDYFLGCPTELFAKSLYLYSINESNVYEYHYKSKIGAEKLGCSKWMGACHANDLWPVFGLPFSRYNQSLDEERVESLRVIKFFTHFAKYGYPSPQNGIDWPQYYSVNDVVIAPYFELSNHSVTQFKNQLKVVECDYLLNKYIIA